MDDLSRLIPRGVALKRIAGWKMVTGRDEDGVTGLREPPVTYVALLPARRDGGLGCVSAQAEVQLLRLFWLSVFRSGHCISRSHWPPCSDLLFDSKFLFGIYSVEIAQR